MSIVNTASFSQSIVFIFLAINSVIVVTDAQNNERITAIKENNQMSVMYNSDSSKGAIDTQPVRCSICNSIATEGLSEADKKRMNAAGKECITNPKKFVKSCDQWRAERPDHPLNSSVRFTGCYKTVFTYEYDIDGNEVSEDRVVRSCGFLGTPGCMKAPGHGVEQKICFCVGPECNGSSSLKSGLVIFISLILSTILLRL